MSVETERKFLVKGEFRHLSALQKEIVQAYLSTDPMRIVRLRIEGATAYLTIKSNIKGQSVARNEWEIPLSIESAHEILNICLPGRIFKTRYLIPSGRHVFEVDVFHDRNEGLVIAEIELADENEHFEKPAWLGKEVTGDHAYYNSNLIK